MNLNINIDVVAVITGILIVGKLALPHWDRMAWVWVLAPAWGAVGLVFAVSVLARLFSE
jgi:hypothetical protein